ncbi:TPA: hypothetical protein HA278_02100 [Candidatus Woesearchaeota archaeon]|nr:hypothetical protein [archaeon]HIJ10828.1 hypothetical protein [Candidatus Woesearchaeota archaeon]|tara:strand:+ start:651 stop:1106 length:456 start_codon:yes stop_codon:yes gene_type:complete
MVRDLTNKHPKYYEATLQLREISQDVVDYVEKVCAKGELKVAKVVELKNGLDYFMSDNELTRGLGKQLQKRFGGELTVTASLHTKKDGKELYRVTVLFRPTPFRKGDLVMYGGEKHVVRAMGKDIFLQNSKTGKKEHIKYRDVKLIREVME